MAELSFPTIDYAASKDATGQALQSVVPAWSVLPSDLIFFHLLVMHRDRSRDIWSCLTPIGVQTRLKLWQNELKSLPFVPEIVPAIQSEIDFSVWYINKQVDRYKLLLNHERMMAYLMQDPECPLKNMGFFTDIQLRVRTKYVNTNSQSQLCTVIRDSLTEHVLTTLLRKARAVSASVPAWLTAMSGSCGNIYELNNQVAAGMRLKDPAMIDDPWFKNDGPFWSVMGCLQLVLDNHLFRTNWEEYCDHLGDAENYQHHWSLLRAALEKDVREHGPFTDPMMFLLRHVRLAASLEQVGMEGYKKILECADGSAGDGSAAGAAGDADADADGSADERLLKTFVGTGLLASAWEYYQLEPKHDKCPNCLLHQSDNDSTDDDDDDDGDEATGSQPNDQAVRSDDGAA